MERDNTAFPHVKFLAQELTLRKSRNPRYSMRAFAQSLDMEPSALSRILTGKQQISTRSALNVARILGLDSKQRTEFLVSVVESLCARAAAAFKLPSHREAPLAFFSLQVNPSFINEAIQELRVFIAEVENRFAESTARGTFELRLTRTENVSAPIDAQPQRRFPSHHVRDDFDQPV